MAALILTYDLYFLGITSNGKHFWLEQPKSACMAGRKWIRVLDEQISR